MKATSADAQVEGFVHPEFAEVGRYFSGLFGPLRAGGGSLVVRRHGETVVDLWKGFADPGGHRPWTRDTLAIGFSTTKGVASTVIHRLADRGLLDYDEPVATYWPEFDANGRARITVRELMSHRAGLHSLRAVAHRTDDVFDHLRMEDRLAAAAPEQGRVHPPTTR